MILKITILMAKKLNYSKNGLNLSKNQFFYKRKNTLRGLLNRRLVSVELLLWLWNTISIWEMKRELISLFLLELHQLKFLYYQLFLTNNLMTFLLI